ncbi:hypothetical protein SNK04_014073 [Fusarium graminearum]
MLEGNRILQQKGDIKFPIPPDRISGLRSPTRQGNSLLPGAADVAMGCPRLLPGKSSAEGDQSGQVDSTRMRQAIRASLGEVVDINGRGEVLAPWGMSEGDFEDRAGCIHYSRACRRATRLDGWQLRRLRAGAVR